MEQLIPPNYNQSVEAGLCHQYSRSVFGVDRYYDPSWQNWLNLKYKHEDRKFPDASVPVWFDWWGKLKGDLVKKQYGHTAVRDKSGKVYSSPLSGTGHAVFNSVDDLVKAFGNGMKYVGWSEDINNVRVVQENDMKITREQVMWHYRLIGGVIPSEEEVKSYTGKDYVTVTEEIKTYFAESGRGYDEYKRKTQKTISSLEAQVGAIQKPVPTDADKKLQTIKDAFGAIKDVLGLK